MQYIKTVDDWTFEVVQIRARKTNLHKEPYTAIANITITNGVPHIEGLLSLDKFSKSDWVAFTKILKELGFDKYYYTRHNKDKELK